MSWCDGFCENEGRPVKSTGRWPHRTTVDRSMARDRPTNAIVVPLRTVGAAKCAGSLRSGMVWKHRSAHERP